MVKVSIVSVTFNAEKYLRKTIESVKNQNYDSFEYLIIDGGSSDNTLNIAGEYKEFFIKKQIMFRIITQKDEGIFDAMNKSLKYLEGEYVLFLNAGDFFTDEYVLNNVFGCDKYDVSNYDIVYGDYYAYYNNYRKLVKSGVPECLPSRMICTHQSIFTKVELLKNRNYNTSYTMTADYDFYLEMFICKKRFLKVNVPIVYFDITGVSQKKARVTQKQRYEVLNKNGCITEKEYNNRNIKIFLICLKKNIVSHLPSFIRFYNYEKFMSE